MTFEHQTLMRVCPDTTAEDIQELLALDNARQVIASKQDTEFKNITEAFYHFDIEGVTHELNDNQEYESEVIALIPRLDACKTAQDCTGLIYEVCARSFLGRVQDIKQYEKLGTAVWNIWTTKKQRKE